MPENLVNFEAVTAVVPGDASRVLLDRVSLGVAAGERIGVVGRNGGGKTTLLELLTGARDPDAGRVSRSRGLRIASVGQYTELPAGARVRDVVLGSLGAADSGASGTSSIADHEWAASPRIRAVLAGMGISDLDRTVDGLSGGERRRVALAAALVVDSELVVLDEPTNHLDVEGIAWLAEHLVARKGGLVVVTHDRWFLDAVCTRTWEVTGADAGARGRVESYQGGYADWVYARAERARLADAAEDRRRNLARKELAWLRRGAPARTSKPRFRIEAAEALISNVPEPRNTAELMAFASARLGRTVVELEDATLRLPPAPAEPGAPGAPGAPDGPGRTLLDRVTWRLGPGDRVGVVGVNGSGKTTLLRALAGERELDGGRLVTGKTVRLAHLTQEVDGASLDPRLRVLEAVEQVAKFVRVGRDEMPASSVAERLGFPASRQWTPVAELSGGERRRLQLTRLLMGEPNVLLLDEPTNDLDIDTLQRLEDLLDSWPGTLVVVSHDRYLVERACDTVVALFGDGRITHLPGGIEEYLARYEEASAQPFALRTNTRRTDPEREPLRMGAQSKGPRQASAAEQREAQKEARRLERRLDALAARETELHTALAEAATEPDRLLALDAELRALLAERADLEDRWLAAAETAET